jgi:hypothetical protein
MWATPYLLNMGPGYYTENPPSYNQKSEDWWSENSLVMTWLWLSKEQQVASNVQLLDTAKKIWDSLEEMYSQEHNVSDL